MKERKYRFFIYAFVIFCGGFSLWKGTDFFKNIGTELIAAGLIAFLFDLILREEVFEEIKIKIRSPLKTIKDREELEYYYVKNFKAAKERIDFIALSFTKGFALFYDLLDDKIFKDGCKIRILILDHNSPAFEARARDEPDRDPNLLKAALDDTVEKFKKFYAEFFKKHGINFQPGGSLRVKTYCGIPYFGYFRADSHCIVTPYFAFNYGIESPVFEIRDPGSLFFKQFEKHFDVLWEREDSKSIIDIGVLGMPTNKKTANEAV